MPSRPGDAPRRRSRLHVMVSPACNNLCLFCLEDRAARGRADFSDQKRALELFSRRDAVLFTCGEPTLSSSLPELIGRARSLGYRDIELVTNGRRISYGAYCGELVDAGLTALTISIHGDCAKVHDALTRAPGSFVQSMAGLGNMAATARRTGRPKITVSTVLTLKNMRRIAATVRMLAAAGADRVIVNYVEPEAEALAHFDAVVPPMSEAAVHLRRVKPPARIEYRVEGIPPCLLPGREGESGDREVIWIYRQGRLVRLRATRRQTKGPICARCALSRRCDGVWIEYARRFGWGEFSPLAQARPAG